MILPNWLHFSQRTFPSANMALIHGKRPVLIDTGFGSDFPETVKLVQHAGINPENLYLVINTHYHSDHVGGNHGFQSKYQIPIATFHTEAALINQRDIAACSAEWLAQPIESYTIDQSLDEGDEIDTGDVVLQVVHTAGHTLGHMSLYSPQNKVFILGDAVHADDVSWVNIFREGAGALQRTMATLEKLLTFEIEIAISGHGGIHHDPKSAIENALHRYERWQKDPQKIAWHACKRIFSYAIMLKNGIQRDDIEPYLLQCPWFQDYSQTYFQVLPTDFIQPLLDEMMRSGATIWKDDKLVALTPYNEPPRNWYPNPIMPRDWPTN